VAGGLLRVEHIDPSEVLDARTHWKALVLNGIRGEPVSKEEPITSHRVDIDE